MDNRRMTYRQELLLVSPHHGKRGKRRAEEVRTSVGGSRGRVWTARNRKTIPIQTDRSQTGYSGDGGERPAQSSAPAAPSAGTTGRKLAVDFYGGNCPIGGSSPWTKDGTKADLALNLYARLLAVRARFDGRANSSSPIFCAISCRIGCQEIICGLYEGFFDGRVIAEWRERRPASFIIAELGLRRPVFAHKCLHGLFKMPQNIVLLNILGEVA